MQALLTKAQSFHQQGKFAEAEQGYRKLQQADPSNPLFNSRLALLLSQTQRTREALPFIIQALEALPDQPDLLKQGVSIATTLAKNDWSETWLLKLIAIEPNELAHQEQLCGVLISNHKEQQALTLSKEIIKKAPNHANAYNLKGLALSRLGDTEKGYKAFQKALKLNPGQIAVIKNLLIYGKGKKEPMLDQLIPQLEKQLLSQQQPAMVKMNIAYILSMYFEKANNTNKSFHYLKLGNDLNRSNYHYSHEQTRAHFDELKSIFSQDLKAAFKDKGVEDAAPIFILGMPRSGTTLIEQILSSHSQVGAEGEISDLKQQFEKYESISDIKGTLADRVDACVAAAQGYINAVKQRQSAHFFTDKMPYNFMLLGLIVLAMPKAKIIHCTRDPLETCFSIYKQNFSGSHAYTNDLKELGQYYREYQNLMEYWQSLFPDRIYDANYERMVDDSETEIARLLAFCELESEEACFAFHKNKRAVRTASVNQVRQPIYKDALKASSPYREQLKPLIDVLNTP